MTKRSTAPARVLAVAALVGGFVVVIAVFSSALGGDGGSGSGASGTGKTVRSQPAEAKKTPKVYVIKNGDTLTAIARTTGVSVARIQRLNPDVDPQILISGEKLKLR